MCYWYKESNEVIVPKQLINDICDIFDLEDLNIWNILPEVSLNNIRKLKNYKTRD